MAPLDARQENTRYDKQRKNRWWMWVVVTIIVILILWLALDSRTDVQREEIPGTDTTAELMLGLPETKLVTSSVLF